MIVPRQAIVAYSWENIPIPLLGDKTTPQPLIVNQKLTSIPQMLMPPLPKHIKQPLPNGI